jgi:hypothetical protein
MTRVPFWIALGIVVVSLGCEDPKETRYKRAMRDIDRAYHALGEGLQPERIRDVPATQRALGGLAERIARNASREEVVTFRDEQDFQSLAQALREDSAELEKAIAEGRLEEAMDVFYPRVGATCTLCHAQYREGGG